MAEECRIDINILRIEFNPDNDLATQARHIQHAKHVTLNSALMYVQRGESALMEATWSGRTGVVKELVEAVADMNLRDNVCQKIGDA